MGERTKIQRAVERAFSASAVTGVLSALAVVACLQPASAQNSKIQSVDESALRGTGFAVETAARPSFTFGTRTSFRQGLAPGRRAPLRLGEDAFGFDQGDYLDEIFSFMESPLGKLQIGRTVGAAGALEVAAPSAARSRGFYLTDFGGRADIGANRLSVGPDSSFGGGFGTSNSYSANAEKIVYFTPRLAGVQLGISWAPDLDANESLKLIGQGTQGALGVDGGSALELGINYQVAIGDMKFSLSGSYLDADQGRSPFTFNRNDNLAITGLDLGDRHRRSLGGGGAIGYRGFTLGASWLKETGATFDPALNALGMLGEYEVWEVGLMYDTGLWAVSVGYGSADQQLGDSANGEFFARDRIELYELSASYSVLPWLDLSTGLQWFDYDAEALLSGEEGVETDDAAVLFLGTSVRF